MSTPQAQPQEAQRKRIPAAERRQALIEAAVHEFAHGGLHGTPVERVAKRVGVAQPYVFALFGSKRELFLAAVEQAFERVAQTFREGAAEYEAGQAPEGCEDMLMALGFAYKRLLASDRDCLMVQHQAYAACDDLVVRDRVRQLFAMLVGLAQQLSGAPDERLDQFLSRGMALNVAAAMGVADLTADSAWVCEELSRIQDS